MKSSLAVRLLASAVGLVVASATPAATWAHAVAHAREGAEHPHHHVASLDAHDVASLDAHDGSAELSAPGDGGGHWHARLDTAAPLTKHAPPLAVAPVFASLVDHLVLRERPAAVRETLIRPPDPGGGHPPSPRGPPLS